MLGLIGWVVLAFYPRYWLATLLSILIGGANVYLARQFEFISPELAKAQMDNASVVTFTFVVIGFGIVFIRKVAHELKERSNRRLAVLVALAKSKQQA